MMKILQFLNLTDYNKLSFTNIAFVIILYKVAISPLDYTGVLSLIPVIALYAHKRHENNRKTKLDVDSKLEQQSSQTTDLSSKVEKIDLALGRLAINTEEVQKVTEEAKKIISTHNLTSAFNKR
jgi:hypothetical protein